MQPALFSADGRAPQRLGCVRVYFGDWRDVAERWPRSAVAIFDPPYGIRYASGMQGRGWAGRTDRGDARELASEIVGDENTRERDDVLARGWPAAAAFGPARLDRVPPWGDPRAVLIWDKGDDPGMGDWKWPFGANYELIWVSGENWNGIRRSSILRARRLTSDAATIGHPTPKPVSLMEVLLSYAPPGVIADPFAGGGVDTGGR